MKREDGPRAKAIARLRQENTDYSIWFNLTYDQQVKRAENAQPGEKWINIQTLRVVEVKDVHRSHGIRLKHLTTCRITTKQCHYFAFDYAPYTPIPFLIREGAAGA